MEEQANRVAGASCTAGAGAPARGVSAAGDARGLRSATPADPVFLSAGKDPKNKERRSLQFSPEIYFGVKLVFQCRSNENADPCGSLARV
ncbi:hypothetical protein EVAR_51894_1 [Eumeta japonica]|uniref:Uncharacterized protein n=1 Tax=Eumeta variegata TaxID=151549 RepID=A0A4C1XGV4_EUMVA|nr:hypothetical protein EVAR_51894_1 [Eumeta japonica]